MLMAVNEQWFLSWLICSKWKKPIYNIFFYFFFFIFLTYFLFKKYINNNVFNKSRATKRVNTRVARVCLVDLRLTCLFAPCSLFIFQHTLPLNACNNSLVDLLFFINNGEQSNLGKAKQPELKMWTSSGFFFF